MKWLSAGPCVVPAQTHRPDSDIHLSPAARCRYRGDHPHGRTGATLSVLTVPVDRSPHCHQLIIITRSAHIHKQMAPVIMERAVGP